MAETTTTTPVKAKPTTRKKRAKRLVPNAQLHVAATFNNTIVTITDKQGGVLVTSSAGACGFRGSKKGTAYAAQVAGEKALTAAKQNHAVKTVDVFVRGIGQGRDAAIRATTSLGIDVESLHDKTGVPHGGVRPKKVRKP